MYRVAVSRVQIKIKLPEITSFYFTWWAASKAELRRTIFRYDAIGQRFSRLSDQRLDLHGYITVQVKDDLYAFKN